MQFTKTTAVRAVFVVCMIVLLNACGSLPEQRTEQTPPTPASQAGDDAVPPPPGLDVSAPDENPYLAQAPNVPAAARSAFERAVNAMQAERWRDAEILLQQLTINYPQLSGPHLNLGIVYRRQGKLELAEQAFAKAIEVNSLNLDAYNQLALVNREAGNFETAEKYYRAALEVWPKHAPSHRNLGILYDLYMGQLEKALRHFEIYQYLQSEEDRRITGWIIDINRRINDSSQAGVQP
ncbi:MAG: tetratricopeptide repeat protein [Cellvibrionaceae bacterium]